MTVFVALGVLALLFAFWLKAVDMKNHYGLEMPNIKADKDAVEPEVELAED